MGLLNKIGNIISGYRKLADQFNMLIDDTIDVIDYFAVSYDKIMYASQGLAGIISDARMAVPVFAQKFDRVKDDYKTLETFIRKPYTNQNNNLASNYSKSDLNKIIMMKNANPNASWRDLVCRLEKTEKIETNPFGIERVLKDIVELRIHDPKYNDLVIINYDERIVPDSLNKEIIRMYAKSYLSLNKIADYMLFHYGIKISAKKISSFSRKRLSRTYNRTIKNRSEARTTII